MNSAYHYSPFIKRLLPFVIMLVTASVSAQESTTCAENLKNAQALFTRGQISTIPEMLGGCIKSGFTREEQLDAYKLLIQTYLFEDKLAKADSAMLDFLGRYPEYELSPTDHSSFVNLFNSFNVRPVFQLTLRLGTNLPFTSFKNENTVTGIGGNSSYNSGAFNLYGALEGKIRINEKIDLCLESGFSQFRFTNIKDVNNYFGVPFAKATYTETRSRVEVPVSVSYDIKKINKLTPYARLGAGFALNISTTAITETKGSDLNNNDEHTGSELSRNDSRTTADLFLQAGGGVKFKTREGYISAELRINPGLMNQVVRGGAADPELGFFYYYSDDDFNLNLLNFSISYTQIFYKPSKK